MFQSSSIPDNLQIKSDREVDYKSKIMRSSFATINLDYLNDNINAYYQHLSKYSNNNDFKILAVVKANGFGHGALGITIEALQNKNVCGIAVACIEEAVKIRKQLEYLQISCPLILIFGAFHKYSESIAVEYNITPTISTLSSLQRYIEESKKVKKALPIHIKIDTGLNRMGFVMDNEFPTFIKELKQAITNNHIILEGLYSHLSTVEEFNKDYTIYQLKQFEKAINIFKENNISYKYLHCMNTGGCIDFNILLNHIPYIKDFNLHRIGAGIYGLLPSDGVQQSAVIMKPVMKWETSITHVKYVLKDSKVGYSGVFVPKNDQYIAVIPIGYADGHFLENLSKDLAFVLIRNIKCPIVAVCMDQIMIDVSPLDNPKEGEDVIIFGTGKKDDIANLLKSGSQFLLSPRVSRIYTKNNKIVGLQSINDSIISETYLKNIITK